jgi:uncharacterized membrane-anchored protein
MKSGATLLLKMVIIGSFCLALQPTGGAQENGNAIVWQKGPAIGKLGEIAQISVPKGYRFTDKAGTQKLLELTQNPSSGDELGALVPLPNNDDESWFAIFEFDESGYVKDDEKDNLDADAMLRSIQQGTEESNKIRETKGWPPFHVTGWSQKPFYALQTHNLTWAILGQSQEQGKPPDETLNYSTRLLGRHGVMKVELVVSPNLAAQVVPEFNSLLDGFSFTPGQRYADWRSGDKIAKYGLAALIVGGAGAAAVNTGLFLKFWKLIVAGFVALTTFLKRILAYIKRLLTGKAGEETPQHE